MTDPLRSRLRWRRAFFALLALFMATVGVAAYAVLDQAVTNTYHAQSCEWMAEDLAVLAAAAPALGAHVTRPALLATLRRQNRTAFITTTDSTVSIGQLEFRFDAAGRFVAVHQDDVPVVTPTR
jgi:hypothetical protein